MFQCATIRMSFMGTQASYQLTNPSYATYEQDVTFLTYMFHKENCKYGAIVVARSALPAINLR